MNKKLTLIVIVIVFLICVISLILMNMKQSKNNQKLESIFDLDNMFWDFLVSDLSETKYNSEGSRFDGIQENKKDYINYFIKANEAIQISYFVKKGAYEFETLNEAEAIVQNLMTTFYSYGYFPRPEYKEYKYGWVSSMDAPTIMLASQMLFELTGKDEYKKFVEDLEKYIPNLTNENGFNFADKKNIWPLEYAKIDAKEDTNEYVLNGSLVGYLSTKAMLKIVNNDELDEYCNRVEKTYQRYFKKFHLKDNMWSRYSLNPPIVIPVHYMIFEEKLFRAAYYLNNIESFNHEYKFREDALSKILHMEVYKNEENYDYYLLRATSPNYYQIDTYGTLLEIYDKDDNIIESKENLNSGEMSENVNEFYDSMMLKGRINNSKVPCYYKVYSINEGNKFLLFERNVEIKKSEEEKKLEYTITTANDAEKDTSGDNIYNIIPELDKKKEGDIIFNFSKPKDFHNVFYAIEVEKLGDINTMLGLTLYDKNESGVSRYYTELKQEKNLIVFDTRGFSNYDLIKNITKIQLRIYDEKIKEKLAIKIGDLKGFTNYENYYNYVMNSEYKINPQ